MNASFDPERIRVLIPARNEEAFIGEVVKKCLNVTRHVLVVCDHCSDRTAEQAVKAGARAENNPGRPGKGAALRFGWGTWLEDTDWDILVILDGDGQHDPAEIPALVDVLITKRVDIAVGSRAPFASPMPRLRRWTNRFMSQITSYLTASTIEDSQCGFRILRRDFLEKVRLHGNTFDLETEMIVAAARRGGVAFFPIQCRYASETSSIQPVRDTIIWLRALWTCTFSQRDLQKADDIA